ncbi:bifunctional diaminohydroxyphosphoribosylaminopyrimidine deaminase/5-amino-6-(5-phosphoribosylamino)uracil reductase RibD [Roseibacterium sp. SDUM158016]|uniref:bifunctional diaminohydroxyphosphoribosylaminopyrimidine deaminase/5-amino-6-(5-phosphoribosylamino)uracil reductase RibD n=1 Tax=Roseicyclus sediminis TaxID=2980997 RepID=UPI0021D17DB6|nr:bifunctional diaminohydroxyphosphoribosylaminopyrimidine deaminase/5-amino-6-(5-phosphoribosylamino)uracil reductase RibD [Roseibacterium sp. SDUM158016]MCU4653160.1 bifunctional diaminohydroxyphosphoribosylaminopyrimidine deaminase/5-amino-6-(5-phosphoribosylamino)uracil reductase RibD [Roseibacterium sp. SDUM158016]
MPSEADLRWMRLALSLGRRGQGRVWPNPAVGCVIVRDGRVVGRGWTQDGGRPHAERVALDEAGAAATGATAYVTLEPCNHTGVTPPCSEALVAASLARVVVAVSDPDPRTAGAGIARLRAAGIAVETGVLEAEAARDHTGFFSRIRAGRPHLHLKLATTLDGRIATATGESRWITGAAARHWVHAQRACHDAVLVGAGTARADDPMLTVRGFGATVQPVRIVLSRRLDLPLDGKLAATAREVPLWLLHGREATPGARDAWEAQGARLLEVGSVAGGHVDLTAALGALGEAGLTRVFCEGGGTLAAALLAGDLVDEISLVTAGKAIGAEGTPAVGAMGIAALSEAPPFRLESTRILGGDVLSRWTRPGVGH